MNIIESTVTLPTSTGPMQCAVFRPSTGIWPGVVLYSEIFQLTGPIRRACAYLAGHGFVVIAPEVYHELEAPGTVLGYTTEGSERGNAHKANKTAVANDSDAAACIDFLMNDAGCTKRIGTMGMCFGGRLAFRAALNPHVLAAACFYPTDLHLKALGLGQSDDSLERCATISGEILFVFGRQDPHISQEGRSLIYQTMVATQRTFTWHEFNAAHAFLRDEGHRYDPQLEHIAWELIRDLFHRRLNG